MDYDFIQRKVYDLIFTFIDSIPIDPFSIVSYFDSIFICSYKEYSEYYNISEDDVIRKFNSNEGFLLKCKDTSTNTNYYIMGYNQNKSKERIRFTIAHELGHFILKHNDRTSKNILNRYSLSDQETQHFETEANHFAKHLLIPFPIALYFKKHLKRFTAEIISNIFNVNFEPANYVFLNLNKLGDYSKKYFDSNIEQIILKKFNKSIAKILYKNRCLFCGHIFYVKDPKFCPICGKTLLLRESIDDIFPYFINYEDDNMIYSKIEINENHKAVKCPKCENEHIVEGDYCQICGMHTVNRCTFCHELLDGDARYCHECGAESTFYINRILTNYEGYNYLGKDDAPF